MLIYFFNLFLIIIYTIFIKDSKVLVFVISLQLFFVLAFRAEDLGVDLENYSRHYYRYGINNTFSETINDTAFLKRPNLYGGYESGYNLFVWLCRNAKLEFHDFLVIHAFLCMTSLGIFFYYFSKSPGLSFYLYVTLGCYIFQFGILRQQMGVAILLFSLFAIAKNNALCFTFLICLASMFHVSCFAMLPHYWLSKIKMNYKILFVFLSSCFFSSFFTKTFFEIVFLPYIAIYGGSKYIAKDATTNNLMILMIIVSILIVIFSDINHSFSNKNNSVLYWGFLFFIMFELISLLARLGLAYNLTLLACLIPNLIEYIKSRYTRITVTVCVMILSFLFFVYTLLQNGSFWSAIIPYRTCF